MIKLDRVSKRKVLHIVLFYGWLCCSPLAAYNSIDLRENYSIQDDSLYIDRARMQPRHFDNLSEKYAGDEFVYERTIETSGWWSRFKKWLSDWLKDLFNIKSATTASNIVSWIYWVGGTLIFVLVIYFLFRAIINKEGKWVFGKSSDKSIIPVTDVENNIHAANFKQLIAEAEATNNYRLAIRYYYLWLLKQLAETGVIEYDVEKTNSDYQNEIGSTKFKDIFQYTSYLYNYIWYGEFDVDQQQFGKAKHAFINFLTAIKA